MERARQKIEEVIQERKRLLEQSQAKAESRAAVDKSHHIVAIGGVAAGLTVALILWLAKSIMTTDPVEMHATEKAMAIHRGEINKLAENIAQLHAHVESLTESVSNLEARLTNLIGVASAVSKTDTERAAALPQALPDSQASIEAAKAFVPTHIARSRVNLRPSASMHTKPITVLNAGTKVEFISESDGWYYVHTQSHGKGWCSSAYLSPLSEIRHGTSTN